jgi:MSHA biogenesis protein MshQ
VTDGTHWTRKIFSFETGYPSQFDPFEFGWQYRKQITIDHTRVTGDLVNFPVLLNIIDTDLSQKARANGDDILFMHSAGVSTRFNYEIESFNHDTGALIGWVNVSHLSTSEDTTFYMYYGNPSCLPQQYPEKTWDSNYKMVQHMNGGAYTTIDDSTSNDNDVTAAGGTPDYLQTGKIGFGTNFAKASSESLTIPRSTSLEPANYITVGGWFKFTTVGTERLLTKGIIGGNGYAGYSFIATATGLYLQLKTTTQLYEVANTGVYALPTGTWTYVTATYDGSNIKFFVNGTQLGNNIAATGTIIHDTGATLLIGTHSTGVQYLDAVADELHISNSARSMSWISTEYNNQNDPSAFLNVGPEEPGP